MNTAHHKQTKILAAKRIQAIKEEKPRSYRHDDEYFKLIDAIKVADYHIRSAKRYNQIIK